MTIQKPEAWLTLKSWLQSNGGNFHPDAIFIEDAHGHRIVAAKDIPADTHVVSCPFNLIITPELSRKAVFSVLGDSSKLLKESSQWTEREWLTTYLSLHWIVEEHESLKHTHYINTLPAPHKLCTPLHFSFSELNLFQGSNLYGATLDRGSEWRVEWERCRKIISEANSNWGKRFTWEIYLTAATYISSRAFPSSLLSSTPTLVHAPSTHPILIPGVDSLNHARAHPVSWLVTNGVEGNNVAERLQVTLVHHPAVAQGQELFNNYGPKPNAELILGYGFSLPNNPDDSIVLKLGGIDGQKWEIGRGASNADGLWKEILSNFVESQNGAPTYEDILDAAGSLQEMTEKLLDRLPGHDTPKSADIRPEVVQMFNHYIDGQTEILKSLLDFARARERDAVGMAGQQGVDLIVQGDSSD